MRTMSAPVPVTYFMSSKNGAHAAARPSLSSRIPRTAETAVQTYLAAIRQRRAAAAGAESALTSDRCPPTSYTRHSRVDEPKPGQEQYDQRDEGSMKNTRRTVFDLEAVFRHTKGFKPCAEHIVCEDQEVAPSECVRACRAARSPSVGT